MSQVRPTEELTFTVDGRSYEAGIDYAPNTGQAIVRVKGLFGSTLATQTIVNARGEVTPWGKERLSTEEQDKFIRVTKESIQQAYEGAGGTANGAKLPSWIDTNIVGGSETGDAAAVIDDTKDNNNTTDIRDNINDFVDATFGEWQIQPDLLKDKFSNITENTIKELMRRGPLNYPQDALYSSRQSGFNQDHVRITQYTYKPPRGSTFARNPDFQAQDVITIAGSGLERSSPLEKYLGMVKLPMPTDISDSNNVNWGSDSMNNLSAAMTAGVVNNLAGAAIGGAVGGRFGFGALGVLGGILGQQYMRGNLDTKEEWQGLKKEFQNVYAGGGGVLLNSTLSSKVLSSAGVQVSPESILARGYGVIPNANMELLFQSPALRSFSFNWKMTPRDEDEARVIRYIIRFFKQGMAARKMAGGAGDSSLYLGTPNVYHIQYKTNQDQNMEGLNRIKTCACTGCSINYTPDGIWSAYEEGQPVSTIMALRFQELEPVYDTDYQNKIIEGRVFNEHPTYSDDQGDLYPIGINEVGY